MGVTYLDMEMMADCHGPDFEFFQTFCNPANVGHAACARHRAYVVGTHDPGLLGPR